MSRAPTNVLPDSVLGSSDVPALSGTVASSVTAMVVGLGAIAVNRLSDSRTICTRLRVTRRYTVEMGLYYV